NRLPTGRVGLATSHHLRCERRPMTSPPDDRAEAAALLAEMRAGVDAATDRLDRMADELSTARARLDLLESMVDVLLGRLDAVVFVVDADRHILGMSRAAIEQYDGPAIGKPLTSVLSEPLGDGVEIQDLPGDAAVLTVLTDD